ncbi:hypothetical protein SBA5_550020 [Candidatus Sulfotelmatomonas gaucii]|uniref:Uncharacterized protein n=1 Tax=Candidatus Sulfuritelmatomonas gaucii TaxID=2043161 RepID=A0A2N9LTP5_9BACT|nr:hypothetical protein SBA5_550020 [Candidatus Sulfotelmatomonas gaucii]
MAWFRCLGETAVEDSGAECADWATAGHAAAQTANQTATGILSLKAPPECFLHSTRRMLHPSTTYAGGWTAVSDG